MFKKRYKLLMPCMLLLLLWACKKDLGNYNYQEINEVSQFKGLNDTTALYGSRFILKPQTTFTQDVAGTDTTKYTYEWAYSTITGVADKIYKISTTRNLDFKVSLVAGNYTFYYGITDKATGVKYRKSFKLKVENEINEGWFLLCDVNGSARLDMLAKTTTDFNVINDLLDKTGSGLALQGKPIMVYTYTSGALTGPGLNTDYAIYVGTDQGTNRLDPETFKWQSNYTLKNEIFGPVAPGFYADQILQSGSTRSYMLGGGDAYIYDRTNQIRYSVPINFIPAEQKTFNIWPAVATNELDLLGDKPGIFYDIDNKRFVKHLLGASSCTVIPDPAAANKLFSFSTGMEMVYMTYSAFNGGEVVSILKDPSTSKRYLCRFNGISNAQSYYAEITGTDIGLAEYYAVSPNLPYLFYTVGSKVYEYDMSLKTVKVVVNKGSEKISLIKFQGFLNTVKYPFNNNLIVCSYDPAKEEGKNGKMEMFTVPTLNADLTLLSSYSGFGKVKSLVYRTR